MKQKALEQKLAADLKQKMNQAAAEMNFEEAAKWRDRLLDLKKG